MRPDFMDEPGVDTTPKSGETPEVTPKPSPQEVPQPTKTPKKTDTETVTQPKDKKDLKSRTSDKPQEKVQPQKQQQPPRPRTTTKTATETRKRETTTTLLKAPIPQPEGTYEYAPNELLRAKRATGAQIRDPYGRSYYIPQTTIAESAKAALKKAMTNNLHEEGEPQPDENSPEKQEKRYDPDKRIPTIIVQSEYKSEYAPNEKLNAKRATSTGAFNPQTKRIEFNPQMNINENKLTDSESAKRKTEKQKYRVVYMQDGKKVEVFASSIRGVRRVVFGKSQYRIYDTRGSDVTGYFKRVMSEDDKK
jgi:hypothetical protein